MKLLFLPSYCKIISQILRIPCLPVTMQRTRPSGFLRNRARVNPPSLRRTIANSSTCFISVGVTKVRDGGVHRGIRRKPEATRPVGDCRRPCPCQPRFEGSLWCIQRNAARTGTPGKGPRQPPRNLKIVKVNNFNASRAG